MQHQNIGHATADEHRVSHPKLVESLAREALKVVKGSDKILSKHFDTSEKIPVKTPSIKPQKIYSGWGSR